MNLPRVSLCASLMLVFALSASSARASTITFETVPIGTADPFSVSVDGINATFTSAAEFAVDSSFFQTLTGRVLLSADSIVAPLFIGFSAPVQNVSLNFATITAAPLMLQAFVGGAGGALVGTVSVLGVVPSGLVFPEGILALNGVAFDTLSISTTALDFAVDNINFTSTQTPAVPEPTSLLLLGTGTVGLIAKLRRRRRTL